MKSGVEAEIKQKEIDIFNAAIAAAEPLIAKLLASPLVQLAKELPALDNTALSVAGSVRAERDLTYKKMKDRCESSFHSVNNINALIRALKNRVDPASIKTNELSEINKSLNTLLTQLKTANEEEDSLLEKIDYSSQKLIDFEKFLTQTELHGKLDSDTRTQISTSLHHAQMAFGQSVPDRFESYGFVKSFNNLKEKLEHHRTFKEILKKEANKALPVRFIIPKAPAAPSVSPEKESKPKDKETAKPTKSTKDSASVLGTITSPLPATTPVVDLGVEALLKRIEQATADLEAREIRLQREAEDLNRELQAQAAENKKLHQRLKEAERTATATSQALQEKLRELGKTLQTAQTENDQLRDKLQQAHDATSDEKKDLQNQLTESNQKIGDLEHQKSLVDHEAQNLRGRITAIEQSKLESDARILDLTNQLQAKKEKIIELNSEIGNLKDSLIDAQATKEKLDEANEQKEELKNTLSNTKNELEGLRSLTGEESNQLKGEIAKLQQEQQKIEEQLKKRTADTEQLKEELNTQLKDLTQFNEGLKNELTLERERGKTLGAEKEQALKKVEEISNELEAVKKAQVGAQKELTAIAGEKSAAIGKVQEVEKEKQKLLEQFQAEQAKIKDLTAKLGQKEEIAGKTQEELRDLKNQHQQTQQNLNAANEREKLAQQSLTGKEKELDDARNEIKELEKFKKELEKEFDKIGKDSAALKKTLEKAQEAEHKAKIDVAAVNAKLALAQKQIADNATGYKKKTADLENNIKAHQEKIKNLTKNLGDTKKTADDLIANIKQEKINSEEKDQKIALLENALEEQKENVENTVTSLEDKLATLQDELKTLNIENAEKLKAATKQISDLQEEQKLAQQILADKEKELIAAQERERDTKSKNEKLEKDLEFTAGKLQTTEQEVANTKSELKAHAAENEKLQQQLDKDKLAAKNAQQALEAKIAQIDGQLKTAEAEKDRLQAELRQSKEDHKDDSQDLSDRIVKYIKNINELEHEKGFAQVKMKNLEEKIAAIEQQKNESRAKVDELEARLKAQEEEMEKLRQQDKENQEKIAKLKNKKEKARGESVQLRNKLQDLSNKLTETELAKVTAELYKTVVESQLTTIIADLNQQLAAAQKKLTEMEKQSPANANIDVSDIDGMLQDLHVPSSPAITSAVTGTTSISDYINALKETFERLRNQYNRFIEKTNLPEHDQLKKSLQKELTDLDASFKALETETKHLSLFENDKTTLLEIENELDTYSELCSDFLRQLDKVQILFDDRLRLAAALKVGPKPAPKEPMPTPVKPTSKVETKPAAPVEPKPAPKEPTPVKPASKVVPTPAPKEPMPTPVKPASKVVPTPAPKEPMPTPVKPASKVVPTPTSAKPGAPLNPPAKPIGKPFVPDDVANRRITLQELPIPPVREPDAKHEVNFRHYMVLAKHYTSHIQSLLHSKELETTYGKTFLENYYRESIGVLNVLEYCKQKLQETNLRALTTYTDIIIPYGDINIKVSYDYIKQHLIDKEHLADNYIAEEKIDKRIHGIKEAVTSAREQVSRPPETIPIHVFAQAFHFIKVTNAPPAEAPANVTYARSSELKDASNKVIERLLKQPALGRNEDTLKGIIKQSTLNVSNNFGGPNDIRFTQSILGNVEEKDFLGRTRYVPVYLVTKDLANIDRGSASCEIHYNKKLLEKLIAQELPKDPFFTTKIAATIVSNLAAFNTDKTRSLVINGFTLNGKQQLTEDLLKEILAVIRFRELQGEIGFSDPINAVREYSIPAASIDARVAEMHALRDQGTRTPGMPDTPTRKDKHDEFEKLSAAIYGVKYKDLGWNPSIIREATMATHLKPGPRSTI